MLRDAVVTNASVNDTTVFSCDHGSVSASGLNGYGGAFVLADMGGADLTRANLSSANLAEMNLSGADLNRADLSLARCSRVNAAGANLPRVNARNSVLSNMHLEGATLTRADFARARITGSYWRDASAVGVGLHRADLRGVLFGVRRYGPG